MTIRRVERLARIRPHVVGKKRKAWRFDRAKMVRRETLGVLC